MNLSKLPHSFYERDTITVAKELLGTYLVHDDEEQQRIGKIVEVEAYLGVHDLASHSSKGITKRTDVMFGPAGFGSAVLIRALEPILNITQRTQGPGLLSNAMHITNQHNRQSLQSDTLYVGHGMPVEHPTIVERPRIGVAYAKEWAERPLRFYIKDNPFISKK